VAQAVQAAEATQAVQAAEAVQAVEAVQTAQTVQAAPRRRTSRSDSARAQIPAIFVASWLFQ
jgi:hypothetical protein